MTTHNAGTDIRTIRSFDRTEKVVFHCALHPEIAYRSKNPFVSQWFPANKLTEECEMDANLMSQHCHCTLKNGIWLTSFPYTEAFNMAWDCL